MRSVQALRVGEEAPDFELPATGETAGKGQKHKIIRLSEHRQGRKAVLSFFPGPFTPVCSVQMPFYEQIIGEFEKYDARLLGISADSVYASDAWAASLGGFSYPLLCDFWPHGHVCVKYGVLREEGIPERAIFVIDRQGILRYIDIHNIAEMPATDPVFRALRACP
ncbi:MAG: redoxin domain-containing protein [Armatimonadetes bacterium]|nr:redoxin domain-containing protein [Armatimonadota bacterium]